MELEHLTVMSKQFGARSYIVLMVKCILNCLTGLVQIRCTVIQSDMSQRIVNMQYAHAGL